MFSVSLLRGRLASRPDLASVLKMARPNEFSTSVFGQIRCYSSTGNDKNTTEDEKQPKRKIAFIPRMQKEDIYTIPNMLSMTRLALSPYIGYSIIQGNYKVALGVFGVAAITDLLDGYIARKFNKQTFLGSVIDPLADKTLMTTLTVTLSMAGLVPGYLASLIIGRDVALISAVAFYRYRSLPPDERTLARYFDASLPTVQLKPTLISKWNTAFQVVLMGSSLALPAIFGMTDHVILEYLRYLVTTTTVLSGLSYVVSKDTVHFLRRARKKRRNDSSPE